MCGGKIITLIYDLSIAVFIPRLLQSSLIKAEVKEGEILPPTIQRLMKGYNKYLRPFFDSKETTHACSHSGEIYYWLCCCCYVRLFVAPQHKG